MRLSRYCGLLAASMTFSVGGLTAVEAADAAPRLSMSGVGPVKFGMTLHQAQRVAPVRKTSPQNAPCQHWAWRGTPFSTLSMLATNNSTLDLALVYRRGVRTTRGIQVGDTIDKVRRKYPTLRMFFYPVDQGGEYYAVTARYRGKPMMMRFSEQRNRVILIVVGPRSVAEHFYECA